MSGMRSTLAAAIWIAATSVAVGCGGSQAPASGTAVGTSHATAAAGEMDAGVADAGVDAGPPAAVTFALENTAQENLVFSLDSGWQPEIFAYSGKPPHAKPIIMFPKFCTAACTTDEADRCPVCKKPSNPADVLAAEKRAVVEPGKTLNVPWDGQVFVYQHTKVTANGHPMRCQCYAKQPVAPATYTVEACGFRISHDPKVPTRPQCVKGQMTFPSTGQQQVEFQFPEPKSLTTGHHHRRRHHHRHHHHRHHHHR